MILKEINFSRGDQGNNGKGGICSSALRINKHCPARKVQEEIREISIMKAKQHNEGHGTVGVSRKDREFHIVQMYSE